MKFFKQAFSTTVIAAAIGFTLLAGAMPASAADISVNEPWARASAGKAGAGGAFMTIHNKGNTDDRLVAAEADVSARTELHTHLMEGDMMKMVHVDAIPVPANGMAELKPGGYHVMFMGLKAPFKEGSSFPLTLVFEKAGRVSINVSVKSVGHMGSGGQMNHGKMEMKQKMKMKHSN